MARYSPSVLALLVLLISSAATAQNVRSENLSYSSEYTPVSRAAASQHIDDWPRLRNGETGTQVHLHSDYRNGDITLFSGSEDIDEQNLLRAAKDIAARLGKPEADFILKDGVLSYVDIELKDYLKHANSAATFDVDLSILRDALMANKELPRPIYLVIKPRDCDYADIDLGGKHQKTKTYVFLAARDIPDKASVRFVSTLQWYAYPACGLVLLLIGAVMCLPFWMVYRLLKKPITSGDQVVLKTPEEVQKEYDKRKALRLPLGLLPFLLPLLILSGGKDVVEQALMVLPSFNTSAVFTIIFSVLLLGMVTQVAAIKIRQNRMRKLRPDTRPAAFSPTIMLVMMLCFVWIFSMRSFNFFGVKDFQWQMVMIFSPLGVMVPTMVLTIIRARQRRTLLPPDNEFSIMAALIAQRAGIKYKGVYRSDLDMMNAFAAIDGKVILTSKLIDKLEPDEIRAIIAHEMGHLRARHPLRTLILSLGFLIVYLVALHYGLAAIRGHVSATTSNLLDGPLPIIGVFPLLSAFVLGGGKRKREVEADRFAVEATGDPELVIRALTKLHTMVELPHQLKKADELLSTHPSLVHRIEAIRSTSTISPP